MYLEIEIETKWSHFNYQSFIWLINVLILYYKISNFFRQGGLSGMAVSILGRDSLNFQADFQKVGKIISAERRTNPDIYSRLRSKIKAIYKKKMQIPHEKFWTKFKENRLWSDELPLSGAPKLSSFWLFFPEQLAFLA